MELLTPYTIWEKQHTGWEIIEKAIKLICVAENVLESMGVVFDKYEQKIKDEIIEKLHEQLTEEEFEKYREEGKKMTQEEACQLIIDN